MQNRYSLWKNLSLGLGLLIAGLYALPNLFGDDPAVQVSIAAQQELAIEDNDESVAVIKQTLAENKIAFRSLEVQKSGILIRFNELDTQIKAKDLIKAALGDSYMVALNLAPRTPNWLNLIGAEPIKLGLDLRGGVHFLLAVELEDMVKNREDSDLQSIISELRKAGIRYAAIDRIRPQGMVITFRDRKSLDQAKSEVIGRLPEYTLTTDIADGVFKLKLVISEAEVKKIVDYAIEQTVSVLRNRVNELGVSEAIVQRQGDHHVSVDLPGIQDTVRAKDLIGKTATLRFQLVDVEHDINAALAGDLPIGCKLYEYEGRKLLLKEQIILSGNSITYATASYAQDGRPSVSVRLGGGGESTFHRATVENIGYPMAIVYVETKTEEKTIAGEKVMTHRPVEKVISVATIRSALGNNFEISGLGTDKYAQDLALLLRSGALVAPVTIIQETAVGPSMGKANIDKGIISIGVGYALVVIFMMLYYRLFGVICSLTLAFNLAFMLAILSILGSTLTLPGMAGMVLTVGLAVDASVLIYERIREELRNGASPQASIYAGYQRALATIIDANVATLIVALVLFALGTGAVKGFAVVLVIGLMTSMLTSVIYSRAVVNLIYGNRKVKKLAIGINII